MKDRDLCNYFPVVNNPQEKSYTLDLEGFEIYSRYNNDSKIPDPLNSLIWFNKRDFVIQNKKINTNRKGEIFKKLGRIMMLFLQNVDRGVNYKVGSNESDDSTSSLSMNERSLDDEDETKSYTMGSDGESFYSKNTFVTGSGDTSSQFKPKTGFFLKKKRKN